MLSLGTPIFLLVPDWSNKRILHPGEVIECRPGVFVSKLDESLSLPDGTDVMAFFHSADGRFMKQNAVVVVPNETRDHNGKTAPKTPAEIPLKSPLVVFRLLGEVMSAQKRKLYRVSVRQSNIRARIDTESNCHIVDISPEGCAAVTAQAYKIGSMVRIHFIFEGETVLAHGRVQTMRILGEGSYRHGFLIGDKISPARKALTALTMAVQRRQLRRLAGAA
jgi:hypothetical protein